MLQDIYKSYVECAKGLGDYSSISKTDLANLYCDADEAHDEIKRNQYYSALMLRYWYKIYEWNKTSSSSRMDIEDYTSWLAESLEIAFKYRSWRNPKDKLYNDPNGPDKVINRCIFSTRNRYYQYYNKDKRKVNYVCDSIERQIESFGDSAHCLENQYGEKDTLDSCRDIINLYLSKNKIIESIIIDGIAYQDSYKESKEEKEIFFLNDEGKEEKEIINQYNIEFSKRKLIKHLCSLNSNFATYFLNSYNVDSNVLNTAIEEITKMTNIKLYKYIDKTLKDMKQNKEVLNLIC